MNGPSNGPGKPAAASKGASGLNPYAELNRAHAGVANRMKREALFLRAADIATSPTAAPDKKPPAVVAGNDWTTRAKAWMGQVQGRLFGRYPSPSPGALMMSEAFSVQSPIGRMIEPAGKAVSALAAKPGAAKAMSSQVGAEASADPKAPPTLLVSVASLRDVSQVGLPQIGASPAATPADRARIDAVRVHIASHAVRRGGPSADTPTADTTAATVQASRSADVERQLAERANAGSSRPAKASKSEAVSKTVDKAAGKAADAGIEPDIG